MKRSTLAIARGRRRGRSRTPPASASIPSFISGSANSATSLATIWSAASASSRPQPSAMPFTAAMTGLSSTKNSVSPAKPPAPWSASMASPEVAASQRIGIRTGRNGHHGIHQDLDIAGHLFNQESVRHASHGGHGLAHLRPACAARPQSGWAATLSLTCASQSFHKSGTRARDMCAGCESTPM